ncbi:MAG: T9SS type A sorting domain-containing protein, partial [Bacteroidales bacterium]|nr:T9SS type A sorting domain-containing protein [Bacteroidales bacterium]
LFAASNTDPYDTTRIFHAMDRARNGEDITIVTIGGSITAGTAASTIDNRWTNIITEWWQSTFPESTVILKNMGIGGTGSDIGTHRMQEDVLDFDPDFIVVEFAVNDGSPNVQSEKMMEGLIRQALEDENLPGVMMLLLMQQSGATAQASHKLVGNYYDVPMVSFADSIQVRVDRDGILLSDVFNDPVHPNDLGMQYIADFIIEELTLIYNALPTEGEVPDIPATIPDVRLTDTYAHCYMYTVNSLVPLTNDGWYVDGNKWKAEEEDNEISFTVDGNAISILYTRHNTDNRGQVDIWVDEMAPKTLDAYWTETWGPGIVFGLIEEDLPDGEHTLHIRVNGNNTGGGTEHYFEILNVNKAGNWEGIAPISNAGANAKTVIGNAVVLDGSESFDPDNETIDSYSWSVVSAPAGNTDDIDDPGLAVTSITPNTAGLYTIGLVVSDGIYSSVQDTKTINVKATNSAPVAIAGNDTTMTTGKYHFLNGLNSYDPDGDGILYSWSIISQPVGEDPKFYLTDTPEPRIFFNETGEYVVELEVNDSIVSNADQITITAVILTAINNVNNPDYKFVCSPNPVTNAIAISYFLPLQQQVTIALHALDGRQLVKVYNENQQQGEHSFEINLSDYSLPNGIYLLRLNTDYGSNTSKIVIL